MDPSSFVNLIWAIRILFAVQVFVLLLNKHFAIIKHIFVMVLSNVTVPEKNFSLVF